MSWREAWQLLSPGRALLAVLGIQRSRRLELKREKRHLDDEITLYFSLLRKVNPGLYARIRVLKDGSLAIAPLPTDVKHEAPRAHVVSRGTMPEPRVRCHVRRPTTHPLLRSHH